MIILFLFCSFSFSGAAVIDVVDDIHSAFVNDGNQNTYQLSGRLFNEVTATVIGTTNSTLQGVDKDSTVIALQTCTASAYLFQVSTGYLAADKITFTYVCAHTLVTVTDPDGVLSFTNVAINQSSNLSYFASSLFNISGHGLFVNFTVSKLKINSTANTLFRGSPVELFFNVCIISDIDFNASATASLVNSETAAVSKKYHFNNTIFANFSKSGNGSGGLFFFNSSQTSSSYTFENCDFENFTFQNTTRGGIVNANNKGSLNFTLTNGKNVTGGINGSWIYSSVETSYFGHSSFHDSSNYRFGLIWVQTGTLAIIGTTFSNLTSICTGAAYCLGTAITVVDSNFTNITSTNPTSGTFTSNTGIYMGTASGLLTISDVTFRNLTGICNVCIWTACAMIGTNVKFLNSEALAIGSNSSSAIGTHPGSPVAWYTKAESTMTNCLCENLTANYYSACCKFYGTSIWNSCIFRYIKGTQNGGMCCQDGTLIADNCTFLNLSTTGDFGGAIHWHSYTDTLIRCLMYNCSAGRTGGALLFGSTYFLGNCDFANNTAGIFGNDIAINSSGSPEPVASASPAPPTPSKLYIYGSCSLSLHPRLNNNTNNDEDQFLPDCVEEIRYVNSTERDGRDTVACGTLKYPCATLAHTALEVFPDDIPLTISLDAGVFVERGTVPVDARPIRITGTITETGTDTDVGEGSVLAVAEDVAGNLFVITSGTMTCTRIHFLQLRGSGSLFVVSGNGTMTLLDCTFAQGTPTSTLAHILAPTPTSSPPPPTPASLAAPPLLPLRVPVVLINNSDSQVHFEGCVFRDITVEDSSALWIVDSKRTSFAGCNFLRVVSVSSTANISSSGVPEAGGAIYSNALGLTLTQSSFTQCTTARNGGAIFFGIDGGLSLTDVIFDRNFAAGTGGALHISRKDPAPTRRYLARVQFANNVAGASGGGNDIRDETATVDSWGGANAIDSCSMSDFRKFSVGDNSVNFERYLSNCYNNPCVNRTVQNCPLECDNSSGVECITGDCTRLHYETTCSASCRMYNDSCVADRCFALKDEPTCLADHECFWDFPSTLTLSSGEVVVGPNTKVCQAVGECTRRNASDTDCTLAQCILDHSGFCVTNKCYVTVASAAECAEDCDWRRGACRATNCTRQGRETECLVKVGDEQCLLEGEDAGEYAHRCTVDVCSGLKRDECSSECLWDGETCQVHACTRLHNETDCGAKCLEDEAKHCVPRDCSERLPRTWESDYLCGLGCFLDTLASAEEVGRQCVATCPKDDTHTGEAAEGVCVVKHPCSERTPESAEGYACGDDCFFDQAAGSCVTQCAVDDLHTGESDSNRECVAKQPCADKEPISTERYPCGDYCFYDQAASSCVTQCTVDDLHTGESDSNRECVSTDTDGDDRGGAGEGDDEIPPPKSQTKQLSRGAIAGIIIGAVLGLLLLIAIIVIIIILVVIQKKKKENEGNKPKKSQYFLINNNAQVNEVSGSAASINEE